jgi:hypothetical protein
VSRNDSPAFFYMKTCSKCKVAKTLDSYQKDRQKKDGLRPSCKECCSRAKTKEILSIEYKRCTKCKKAILKSLFSHDSHKKDGYYSSCKDCVRKKDGVIKKSRSVGTVYIDTSGYKRIAGISIRQHRYVIQNILKRKLAKDEHVHHINGNKTDNRPENLEILTASEHHRLHGKNRKPTIIEPFETKCILCYKVYATKSYKAKYCSTKCKNYTRKEYFKEYMKTYKKPVPSASS